MIVNKHIQRDGQDANKIFDQRSLEHDYRTLRPLLRAGMHVLDVGCGTGSISKDIAAVVGPTGSVTGIDNTEKFIRGGKESYGHVANLTLVHADLFAYNAATTFDLVVSARTLQWLSHPLEALQRMHSLLKDGGRVSILDYNHEAIAWHPAPPASMQEFYNTFLKWRADAGMNNRIAEDLPRLLREAGFHTIQSNNSDEHYHRGQQDFASKAAIWSKVAGSRQMVDEGYVADALRLQAIDDYNAWIQTTGVSMTMKLIETNGIK